MVGRVNFRCRMMVERIGWSFTLLLVDVLSIPRITLFLFPRMFPIAQEPFSPGPGKITLAIGTIHTLSNTRLTS
jgi:hypothetical protein